MKRVADKETIEHLQKKILDLQRNCKTTEQALSIGLSPIESAFPGKVFPRGVVHELISDAPENASCTNAFISVLLGKLMRQSGYCLWVSNRRRLFPPALKIFGVEPERILFVDVSRVKDALWTLEEALKC